MYIKWENGEIDLVEDALLDEKLKIEELYNNTNIEIIMVDKNEN